MNLFAENDIHLIYSPVRFYNELRPRLHGSNKETFFAQSSDPYKVIQSEFAQMKKDLFDHAYKAKNAFVLFKDVLIHFLKNSVRRKATTIIALPLIGMHFVTTNSQRH